MAKKKKQERIPFTKEQVERIRNAKSSNELKDLAFMFDRSYDSVRRKKWKLENPKQDLETRYEYKAKVQAELANNKCLNNRWSKVEEELILTSDSTDIELARLLNRTVGAVQVKRVRLMQDAKRKHKDR